MEILLVLDCGERAERCVKIFVGMPLLVRFSCGERKEKKKDLKIFLCSEDAFVSEVFLGERKERFVKD